MIRGLALGLFGGLLLAQAPQPPGAPAVEAARIEGQVLSDLNGQPLRRAHVTLRPLEAGLTAMGAEADEKGNFALRNVTPGRYSLIAERDGYLASATFTRGALRSPDSFVIGSGDRIAGVEFRLRPWAVLSGRIRFDDGEPGGGVRVELYREYHSRGRHAFSVAGSTLTNDLGEYRLYGLPAGSYFLAATYARQTAPGYIEQPPVDAEGKELPVTGYSTTFYPHTTKLGEALPVHLDYGQEAGGFDLFLELVRKVKVRGHVTSGVSGTVLTTAAITLARADATGFASIATPARPTFDREGAFEIRDVAPGSYVVTVDATEAGKSLTGRAPLTVAYEDVSLELLAAPPLDWSGSVVVEGGASWPPNRALQVTLEPRSDTGAAIQPSVRAMSFDLGVLRDEVYDVFLDNLVDDFYVAAVRVGGIDVRASGLAGNLASQTPFQIVLDARGGKVSGRVFGPDGTVWSGAKLMLVPDDPLQHLQSYRPGAADQYGIFQIRGVAPGRYTLVAWLDAPPCDVYDAGNLDACRAAGTPVSVEQSGEQILELTVKRAPELR